jgi:hypothetical protein
MVHPASAQLQVADTQFSIDRGFFDAPFSVAISTLTPGATIRYTTDGSWPSPTHGQTYASPILISQTTVLRAMAHKTGMAPTSPAGRTTTTGSVAAATTTPATITRWTPPSSTIRHTTA